MVAPKYFWQGLTVLFLGLFVSVFSFSFIVSGGGEPGPPPPNPDPAPGVTAEGVLGQTQYTANTANRGGSAAAGTLSGARGIFVSATQTFVADTANSRILIWNSTTPADGADADIVLGQADFTSTASGTSSSSLYQPEDVYSDGSKIYVADTFNSRVLIWNTISPSDGQDADIILGQVNSTTSANPSPPTASSMYSPNGVFSNGSKIFVADSFNARVLIWNTTSPINGQAADIVLGQADFVSADYNRGGNVAANGVNVTNGIYATDSKIYVADGGNNRVLVWNTTSPTNGQDADIVLGQPDFVTGDGTATATGLSNPQDIASDGNNIFVSDQGNRRVVVYPTSAPATGAAATAVFGKSIFTDSASYDVSATTLVGAHGVSVNSSKLYVADESRMLRFSLTPATPGAPTVGSAAATTLGVTIDTNSNPDMTQYALYESVTDSYVQSNSTLDTAPTWQTNATWGTVTVTGLTASTQYTFTTVGRYANELNTATSTATSLSTASASAATNLGGGSSSGGGSLKNPITGEDLPQFLINEGAKETTSRNVTLNFNMQRISKVAVSNISVFSDPIAYELYKPSMSWVLPPGVGTKTVYIRFVDLFGSTIFAQDNINLVEAVVNNSESTETGEQVSTNLGEDQQNQEEGQNTTTPPNDLPSCPLPVEAVYKKAQSPGVYYVTKDCTKRPFNRSDVYFTYYRSWADVQVVSELDLNSIPDDELSFMPWGPLWSPAYSPIVKTVTDPKVYLVSAGQLRWISSEEVFNALGYEWSWIEDVAPEWLAQYGMGEPLTETNFHPAGTLVKYADSSRVYVLAEVDGELVKRPILSDSVFEARGYRLDRIITISNTEQYKDGLEVN